MTFFLIAVCFSFGQALEESAASAAEEERRRLQTQTELQDRYRMDLEREKMVRRPFVIYQCIRTSGGATNTNATSCFCVLGVQQTL